MATKSTKYDPNTTTFTKGFSVSKLPTLVSYRNVSLTFSPTTVSEPSITTSLSSHTAFVSDTAPRTKPACATARMIRTSWLPGCNTSTTCARSRRTSLPELLTRLLIMAMNPLTMSIPLTNPGILGATTGKNSYARS